MLKYAGEYCEYGEAYGEAADACQSLVAVIKSRDAGVKYGDRLTMSCV